MTSLAEAAYGVGGLTNIDARAKAISSGDAGSRGVTVEAGDVAAIECLSWPLRRGEAGGTTVDCTGELPGSLTSVRALPF